MKKYISLFISVAIFAAISLFAASAYAQTAINESNTVVTVTGAAQYYDGNEKQPEISVTCNQTALTKGSDYTVQYSNNISAGTGSITVTGIGEYSGSVSKSFSILPNDISSNSLVITTLSFSSANYTGAAITPSVTVTFNNKTLTNGTDYTVSYSNNVNPGTAYVTVSGIGNFTGTQKKSFKIKSLSLSASGKTTVSFEKSSLVYNGSKVVPIMYVLYDKGGNIGKQYLIQDVDYKVSYSKNNAPGKATAKITGLGGYTGSVSKTFIIYPSKVSSFKLKKLSDTSIKLSWKSVSKVSGYEVMLYNSSKKKYTHLAYVSSKKTSYKITGLKTSKGYKYVVRAYKTISNKKYYGEKSTSKSTFINPAKVRISSVTLNKTTLTVEWGKVSCSGYEVFYTTDSKFKKNIKSVKVSSKKKSVKIKNLKKNKKYYVKVRAYTKYNGKTYYGAKSTVISSYFSNVYATYYSYYTNNANRTNNLRIASKAINGTIIQPGEEFNFNTVVGPRTSAKGYKNAHVFAGEQVVEGIGGGICQVASTMFNTALKANVTITERHQHDQRVSYVPLGRDAAISGTAQNFRWKNNTKYAIKIEMKVSGGKISCTFYTCQKAKPSKVTLKVSQSGKKFTLTRRVKGKVNYKTTSTY